MWSWKLKPCVKEFSRLFCANAWRRHFPAVEEKKKVWGIFREWAMSATMPQCTFCHSILIGFHMSGIHTWRNRKVPSAYNPCTCTPHTWGKYPKDDAFEKQGAICVWIIGTGWIRKRNRKGPATTRDHLPLFHSEKTTWFSFRWRAHTQKQKTCGRLSDELASVGALLCVALRVLVTLLTPTEHFAGARLVSIC